MLRQRSERAWALLIQARDEALAEELAEEREQSERDAAALRETLIYDPGRSVIARAKRRSRPRCC